MLLQGKNALITGAARGIGAATVEAFAAEGANVWAFARTPDPALEARCQALSARYGGWVRPLYADLADEAAVSAAVRAAMGDKLPLDILVNNAGMMGEDKVFQLTPVEEMRRLFEANFFGPVVLTQLATRWMARKRKGAVVNVASVAGLDGSSRLDYSASKAAVISATRTMARELAGAGIRVNAVAPGYTDTDMTRGLGEKVEQEAVARALLRRKGKPEEIAAVIAFLASDRAAYVTAQVWRVDGGIL
ncbi:MAG: SDR family oxidoreductase [Clostridiales bacterium]|nr:SDR family oxidoreductase [Clostridiales bacterium]